MQEQIVSFTASKLAEQLGTADIEAIRVLTYKIALNAEKIIQSERLLFACKKLYKKSFFEGTSGNVSVRLSDGSILITPSAVSKDSLRLEELVRTDLDGNVLEGFCKPSSEIKMHLAVYKNRAEITACIHAHPPFSVAFCASSVKLDTSLLAEAALILGEVPCVKYATPSTNEVPDFLIPHLKNCNNFLLSNHGLLALGLNLDQALSRAETLEFTAKVTAIAKGLGEKMNFLSRDQLAYLFDTHS